MHVVYIISSISQYYFACFTFINKIDHKHFADLILKLNVFIRVYELSSLRRTKLVPGLYKSNGL